MSRRVVQSAKHQGENEMVDRERKVEVVALDELKNGVERPGLESWRRRHGLRRSSAAQPHQNRKRYTRQEKHRGTSLERGGMGRQNA
jgi:hypothetical protein